MDGQGVTKTYANGDKYEGPFVDDKKHGQGILTFANGDKYEGPYVDDKRHGQGIFTFASGNKYEGPYVDDKMNGQGIFTYASGAKYEGPFVDNKKHGQGIFTFADGTKYEGPYVDDKMNGQGIYTYANADKYEGQFVDDKKHGQGILTCADGDKYAREAAAEAAAQELLAELDESEKEKEIPKAGKSKSKASKKKAPLVIASSIPLASGASKQEKKEFEEKRETEEVVTQVAARERFAELDGTEREERSAIATEKSKSSKKREKMKQKQQSGDEQAPSPTAPDAVAKLPPPLDATSPLLIPPHSAAPFLPRPLDVVDEYLANEYLASVGFIPPISGLETSPPRSTESDLVWESLKCPISLALMKDPVVCADGHSYERANIEDWLTRSDLSPVTKIELENKALLPNLMAKRTIELYLGLYKVGGVPSPP